MSAELVNSVLGSMTREQRASFLKTLRSGERSSTWTKYYSTVRFGFNRTGADPFTYTVANGTEYRAFGYAIGQDMSTVAGFAAGTTATFAETNLQTAGQSVSGDKVIIYGISVLLCADSDSQLTKLLWRNVSVALSINGDDPTFRLGTPEFIPGAGGLTGFGADGVVTPDLASSINTRNGAMANGLQSSTNFLPFPQPVIWNPAGQTDSSLVVRLRAERDVQYTTLVATRAAAAGVAAWVPATAAQAQVILKVHLHARQLSPRGENA